MAIMRMYAERKQWDLQRVHIDLRFALAGADARRIERLRSRGLFRTNSAPVGIRLYNGDMEAAEGLPEPVVTLKEQIARGDGLLRSTPEPPGKSRFGEVSSNPAHLAWVIGVEENA